MRITIAALWVLWGTRLASLTLLPMHNDEGLHLQRAIEVWNGHIFWNISDGKIINHWLMAIFGPQNAPDFVARIGTVFIAMIGLSAALRLAQSWQSAVLVAAFWVLMPILFFFERIGQSDAQAGALVLLAIVLAVRLAQDGKRRTAILTGLALAVATLFKFTAAPFAVSILLIVLLWGDLSLRKRVESLVTIAVVGGLSFALPLAYLILRSGDFGIALGWIGGGGGGLFSGVAGNLARLWETFGFCLLLWLVGWLFVAVIGPRKGERRRDSIVLLGAALLPGVIMLLLAHEIEPRHFAVLVPAALTLAARGWAKAVCRMPSAAQPAVIAALSLILLVWAGPFMWTAWQQPSELDLPAQMARQYQWDHSAGFGLQEAVQDFPATVLPDVQIVGDMFPDSCKRANFYASSGYVMTCQYATIDTAISDGLSEEDTLFVLQDTLTGRFDAAAYEAALVAVYTRPGETEANATIRLWQIGDQ